MHCADVTPPKMAADSDPESEVFEITDFTTASEWERFISKVEEVLNEWKLIGDSSKNPPEKGEYTTGFWEEKGDEVCFADFKFSIKHHYFLQESCEKEEKEDLGEDALPVCMQDLLCTNNDFPPIAHCLVRWYGMREFVVITPAANDAVISESKCNLLLSSISIALGNTGCQVPLFVQIHQKWRKLYVGECQGPGVRTDFEMVHLRKVPNQYTHLSGLLDIFKSKIGCPLTSLPPVSIAIRFTYILQDWQQYFWPQQPPAPMTEDLLEEQSEVLAKLGTSAEGAHLRARMQSACLLSDMESFKGANPGCCLEDFVRWYSPRDYVEEEVVDEDGNNVIKGELSARMKIPNNMWAEAWETAKATPARRQRRLFDDTKEAEKVLHYLAVQKPADLTRHLLPCVIHAALLKVKEEEIVEDIPSLKKTIKHIISHSSKVLRFPNPDDKKLEDINNQIMNVEATIARARSLKAKFGIDRCDKADEKEDLEKFVSCLLEQPEVPIVGAGRGPAGCIIHKMFVNAQRVCRVIYPWSISR
ncbi:hypothetical protein FKM82_015480 [Ascaphus truei]